MLNRRSDYKITKQADYGDNRWSVSFTNGAFIAYFNTRDEARKAIATMIQEEANRSSARIAEIKAMLAVA